MTNDTRRKALLALEGSNRGHEALCDLRDYLAGLIERVGDELPVANFDLEFELKMLLRGLQAAVDPAGDSPYRLQIVPRREGAGRPPNPRSQERRLHMAVLAAVTADSLLADHPGMQKKEANSRAANAVGVTIGELYAARKEPKYVQLRDQLKKTDAR